MLERYSNFICIHERLCSSNLSRTVLSNNGPLPKNQVASQVSDYKPISLINSMVKIITTLLANRLAPHMNSLVSIAQNAFIKKRCIHDNFIYVQRVIQLLHKRKKPALFIKLDISKAFDSIG